MPGRPDGPGFRTIEGYARYVEEFLAKNSITDPVLVGHSMGGAIAIEYALNHDDLKGLVLVGTGARLRVRQDLLARILEDYDDASKIIARLSVSPNADTIIAERLAREMLKVPAEVTHGDFEACNRFDRINDVEKISCKTLIVCGTDDQMTPPKYSQYLREKIRDSKLVLIPGAGHSVMMEKHREFNEALEAFLASL